MDVLVAKPIKKTAIKRTSKAKKESRLQKMLGYALASGSILSLVFALVVMIANPPEANSSVPKTIAANEETNLISLISSSRNQAPETYLSLEMKKGKSLSSTLMEAGLSNEEAKKITKEVQTQVSPTKLATGQKILISFDNSDESQMKLASVKIPQKDTELEIKNDGGEITSKQTERKLEKKVFRAANGIYSSLYKAGMESGVSPSVMLEIIKIYSYDVDFQRDIKDGDRFEILYEAYVDGLGRRVKDGNIIYANLEVGGKDMKVYRHALKGSEPEYFTEDGKSTRKALLRTPINGARITSRFGVRVHPLLGYSKMHKGVDFGAPTGTPIYAAGNGTVDFAGWQNGYGNFVKIRHNSEYTTAYGHASRIASGIKRGARVKQGQIIAYVGSTGWSTGPHLHYETMFRGVQVNPSSIKNIPGTKLAGSNLNNFKQEKKQIDYMLANLPLNKPTKMASKQ